MNPLLQKEHAQNILQGIPDEFEVEKRMNLLVRKPSEEGLLSKEKALEILEGNQRDKLALDSQDLNRLRRK